MWFKTWVHSYKRFNKPWRHVPSMRKTWLPHWLQSSASYCEDTGGRRFFSVHFFLLRQRWPWEGRLMFGDWRRSQGRRLISSDERTNGKKWMVSLRSSSESTGPSSCVCPCHFTFHSSQDLWSISFVALDDLVLALKVHKNSRWELYL